MRTAQESLGPGVNAAVAAEGQQPELLVSPAAPAGDLSDTLTKVAPEANVHHVYVVLAQVPAEVDPETRIQSA